ncbi:lysophospholipase L1-like esterase [Rhizobium phage RHEph10]|uniref:lysophospholipase L1-like esterase n=1 Tax=Rhizobium phage RHEph10 TaxID=1220717 RepID=UPI0002AB4BC8|nr:lysophospholipase L1-like esterase [Rhizobium phage RHEph10]AGC36047.1 hypothetical protein RHEph10_gp003 [Rhizobium phage RHEph10]
MGHPLLNRLLSSVATSRPVLPAVDPNRYMFFATRNRVMTGVLMTAPTGLTSFESTLYFGCPDYKTRDFVFHFSGIMSTEGGAAPAETLVPANDMVLNEVYLVYQGVEYPILFSGQPSVTIVKGSDGVFGNVTLPFDLPRLAKFGIRTYYSVPADGNFVCGYRVQRHRGETFRGAGSLAALKALVAANGSTPALDINYNLVGSQASGQQLAFGPDFMVSKGDWDGRPVLLVIPDSIGESRQEIAHSADDRGNLGVLRRFLDDPGSIHGRIPNMFIAGPGAAASRELTTGAFQRWRVFDQIIAMNGGKWPCTGALNQMGFNDSNAVPATWIARPKTLVASVKTRYPGMKVFQTTITSRATSTDLYRTTAGQTVPNPWKSPAVAGDANTGLGQLNDAIRANIGNWHDGVVEVYDAWSDPDNPNRWRSSNQFGELGRLVSNSGSGDGITPWNQAVSSVPLKRGYPYLIEYQPGLWSTRTVYDCSPSAPYQITFIENFATIFQPNAKIQLAICNDGVGVHPTPGYVEWMLGRMPQSMKDQFPRVLAPA